MLDLREHALAFGVQNLADVDLLTLLLGTGSAGESVSLSAAALLERSGGLAGIARLGPHALARRGIGPAKATRVAAAIEVGRRALQGRDVRPRLKLKTPASPAHPCGRCWKRSRFTPARMSSPSRWPTRFS